MPIRDLTHGVRCDMVLLVRGVERRTRRDGRDFLKVTFGDRTGTLTAMVWDDVDEIAPLLIVGEAFAVTGAYEVSEKFGPQLKLEGFQPAADGTYDASELRAGPPVPVSELEHRLRALIASVEDQQLRQVLDLVLGEETETWQRYRIAPAAKRVHQAYRHGLLEHCLTVAEAVSGAAPIFPGIDRDLAVSAALIHDIGKLDAYRLVDGDEVELTDDGKLRGEIVLGYERLHGVVDQVEGMTEVRKRAFLHIILAHHGQLEHGSPVVPQTREAFLVHTMDNLGGKLGIIDRLEQERQPGSTWSGYDRAFGGSVWFEADAEEELAEFTSAPSAPAPAPQAPAAVPQRAFEETAWNPPHPDHLDGSPIPQAPFTEPPPATATDEPASSNDADVVTSPAGRDDAPPATQPLPF